MQIFRATLARSANGEGDAVFEDTLVSLQHARFGRLKFYSPPLAEIPNPAGNLHLAAYLPAGVPTSYGSCPHSKTESPLAEESLLRLQAIQLPWMAAVLKTPSFGAGIFHTCSRFKSYRVMASIPGLELSITQ